ncbi:MAG TPA: glycosyltransferase [Candidatus Binatia bacterium]|nr:glycosyltransferase [Candidatus Binatia bacterium]
MYVRNDVRRDSRVLREARTLAAAGHHVTIIGTTGPDDVDGDAEVRDGVTLRRVRPPAGRPLWTVWFGRPWRLYPYFARQFRRASLGQPRSVALAGLAAATALATLPWLAVRAVGRAATAAFAPSRRPPRGVRRWDDYLGWWMGALAGWHRRAVAAAPPADVHHGHDFDALPAAAAAARRDGSRYVYDSHELFLDWRPQAQQPWWLRAVIGAWERRLARHAAAVVTVNAEIAEVLARRFGVPLPLVVHNCPSIAELESVDADEGRRHLMEAGVPSGVPVVLCHGSFQPGRGLEEVGRALLEPGLVHVHLVFLGYPLEYVAPIAAQPGLAGRVHLLPGVDPTVLLTWIAGADVTVATYLPIDRNHRLSTPNKLFESLAAGVPVVSSDFPARRRILLDDPLGPLGAVCDPTDPRAIAAAIRSILELPPEERAALRARCRRAALERWNWETEGAKLVALYERLEREGRR